MSAVGSVLLAAPVVPLQLPLAVDLTAVVVGALAGASVAVRDRLDVVGGLLLAVAMGLGGGIIRDVLLGQLPVALSSHAYLPTVAVAAISGLVFASLLHRLGRVVAVLDAFALALFTVVGVEKALLANLPAGSAVFVGVSAAVGGGIIVDLLAGRPVAVVRRGPWNATAALVGASVYLLSSSLGVPSRVCEAIGFVVIAGMRIVSLRWGVQNPESVDVIAAIPVRRRGDPRPPPRRPAGRPEVRPPADPRADPPADPET
ncbi:MAG TPA: TRIC cation channel family protein [Actinotalea sp.]|jgi:uncharacterized membrane protein YeiH